MSMVLVNGEALMVLKVKKFVEFLFEKYVSMMINEMFSIGLCSIGLFDSFNSIVGYIWYHRFVSLYVCFALSL